MESTTPTQTQPPANGAFIDALKRNGSQIKGARAAAIAEGTEMAYRRKVEDLDLKYRRLLREQENRLDMSPDNVTSLIVAKNFNEVEWVDEDCKLALQIREARIELEEATARYNHLFKGGA